ncbi:hypothetical protein CLV59_109242 [Chitinophaga dinghuensis]|uniref:Uncharacterized protein n=1 Tax=Chitinophaga dinghuensis TaxID=1539050 RepID=A0A327VPZ6_9BACT|nr:hypothetical protein [Chitinophaga dinghuensis]RAJ75628.1 hypothetical protein CLV59_109242 [Chitinophaga dinghuensis]
MNGNHRYTIGTIYKIDATAEGLPAADFNYMVKGKRYSSFFSITKGISVKAGDKYWVIFYPDNPKNSDILLDDPVLTYNIDLPEDGYAAHP